ncbi:MAG: DNA polymerase III subunit gamma/tau [Alistipes sp.]
MSDFIVSARKYRPATFASVVGQKHITSTLKNAIERGQLAHAYLFCGPRGVGKTTCARIFAKAINCLNPNGSEACNECESCRSFNEGRSLNIHELDAASNNSVEDIRTLIEQVRIIPQVGRYSVFIIDEVHMLSAAAFNAFLKTLEEPPAHAIFILATTEKHKIIPTILSRCQIYDFNRIRVEDGVEYLKYIASQEGIAADEESLNLIAQKADGVCATPCRCSTRPCRSAARRSITATSPRRSTSGLRHLLQRHGDAARGQLCRYAGDLRQRAVAGFLGADLHGGAEPPHARPADGQAPRNAAADRNDRDAARTIPDAGGRLQCRVPVRGHLLPDGARREDPAIVQPTVARRAGPDEDRRARPKKK